MSESDIIEKMRTVSPDKAFGGLVRGLRQKRPMFVWGPPGIGKSELITQIADSGRLGKKVLVIDLRLALMDPTDLRGYPFRDPNTNTMMWAPAAELPTEDQAKKYDLIILFLDELNSAAPNVQAAAYQLVLNRRIGLYKLPDNVAVCGAGNRESDRGVVYRMPAPLANRFVHMEMRADYDSWVVWAIDNRIHPDVVSYVTQFKADLFHWDPKQSDRAFPTPRSWKYVSDFVWDDEANTSDVDELRMMVAGSVNEGIAGKFMKHREMTGKLPNPSDVLSGKVDKLVDKELSIQYAIGVSLVYELLDVNQTKQEKKVGDNDVLAMLDNFFGFININFSPEIAAMVVSRYLVGIGDGVDTRIHSLPAFTVFFKKYGKLMTLAHNL